MKYNVVLFGSCLQFLQTPKQIVEKLSHSGLQAFVIERTPIVYDENTKLTVQQVREPIYESSYPAWHFAENELMSWFTDDFDLRYKFNGPHIINKCDGFQSQLEDYVFTRKSRALHKTLYCTYFNYNFAPFGLSLLESLSAHDSKSFVYVLCLDNKIFSLLKSLQFENVELIKIIDLENAFPELAPLNLTAPLLNIIGL